MSAPPRVSVLLPVRDGGAHLADAIASLEAQTLADFEVIAVDDGSTDETPDLLGGWAARDRRVRVLRLPPSGIVAALERGRAEARGSFLARMDADDLAEPERLARQLELMVEAPSVVACGCGVSYFPRDGLRDGALRYEAWINAHAAPDEVERELFVECPLAHPTFFLRADAVERAGGYRDRGWPEDYDLLLRLWAAGGRLASVPSRLLLWRDHPRRLSRRDPRYAPEAFLACKVHWLRRTLLREREAVAVWGAGPVGKAAARALLETGTAVTAFVEVDPRKIGQTVHGAPVLDAPAGLALGRVLHLAAVGQKGARERLRETLVAGGLTELDDFVAIA